MDTNNGLFDVKIHRKHILVENVNFGGRGKSWDTGGLGSHEKHVEIDFSENWDVRQTFQYETLSIKSVFVTWYEKIRSSKNKNERKMAVSTAVFDTLSKKYLY